MADKPVTREEKYLAYLTGDYTGELPKPITRKEKYLYELCLKGMGGEVSPEEIKNAVNEYLEKNPVKPGATTEQAQQIEQNKTDVASLKEETGSLKEDLTSKADKTSIAQTDRKLDALWKLNQGISYEFQTDDTEAYQKTIPSGAKVANVKSIGGKTIVWNQLINGNTDKDIYSFVGQLFKTNIISGISVSDAINNLEHLIPAGHKILVKMKCLAGNIGNKTVTVGGYHYDDAGSNTWQGMLDLPKNTDLSGKTFYKLDTSTDVVHKMWIFLYDEKVPMIEKIEAYINYFDLTQMFGSGNEPSTTEEFEAMFPADYYPYNAGELMSAPVNEVIYLDTKNQETSYPIPQAILNLPGYGWSAGDARNEVDWENKQYIQRVGKADLGTFTWEYYANRFNINGPIDNAKPNGVCLIIPPYYWSKNDFYLNKNFAIYIHDNRVCYIYDSRYDSTDAFKQAINGVMLYYELAEPIVTDITDIIGDTFQEPLEVEAGGTLTFKNSNGDDYRIPVPSTEEYLVSLAEVAK